MITVSILVPDDLVKDPEFLTYITPRISGLVDEELVPIYRWQLWKYGKKQ